jgi:hypothetical protein
VLNDFFKVVLKIDQVVSTAKKVKELVGPVIQLLLPGSDG